jgi:hypothetical protein
MIDRSTIKQIALEQGFKLKEQPDGSMDLNPYVYTFARVLETQVRKEIIASLILDTPNNPEIL